MWLVTKEIKTSRITFPAGMALPAKYHNRNTVTWLNETYGAGSVVWAKDQDLKDMTREISELRGKNAAQAEKIQELILAAEARAVEFQNFKHDSEIKDKTISDLKKALGDQRRK